MKYKIRPISKKDNVATAQMIRAVFDEHNAPKAGTVYTDPTTDQLFKLFTLSNAQLLVAEVDGKVEGCCGIFPTANLPHGYAELVKFYVSSKIRGKGIGRQLYEACETLAISFGYTHLYIESIDAFSNAIRIYEKIGFKMRDTPLGNSGHFGCPIWLDKKL